MDKTALSADPVFETVDADWWLPDDSGGFLKWLANSGAEEATDYERVRTFMTYPAAKKMPASLRSQLTALNLL